MNLFIKILVGFLLLGFLAGLYLVIAPSLNLDQIMVQLQKLSEEQVSDAGWKVEAISSPVQMESISSPDAVESLVSANSSSERMLPHLTIYLPSQSPPFLREVRVDGEESIRLDLRALRIFQELTQRSDRGTWTIPPSLRAVYIYGDHLLIDLDEQCAILFRNGDLGSLQLLYSMVNSLLQSLKQEKLLILFGGKLLEENMGFDFRIPLHFNPALVRDITP